MEKIKDYRIIYYYSKLDDAYLATIPELAGCIADGDTIHEAIKNVREVGNDWLELAAEDGDEIPAPTLEMFPRGDSLSIGDVAAYILDKTGRITTMAFQKYLYYCDAWSCGWYGKPLFPECFEAWVGGPMNRELYNRHKGAFIARKSMLAGMPIKELSDEQKRLIDSILRVYGEFDADVLSEMTHTEEPWKNARGGLLPSENGNTPITDEDLCKYYGAANTI